MKDSIKLHMYVIMLAKKSCLLYENGKKKERLLQIVLNIISYFWISIYFIRWWKYGFAGIQNEEHWRNKI